MFILEQTLGNSQQMVVSNGVDYIKGLRNNGRRAVTNSDLVKVVGNNDPKVIAAVKDELKRQGFHVEGYPGGGYFTF